MNTNIAKLQAQLQGLSPQQIQMAVQGGSVPPWLAAVEQQRRMDLSKRMQGATPPRSTVVQDMQAPQGIQAYAGGGGVRRKRPEEEGIAASVPYAETDEAQLMPVLMGMPDDQFNSLLNSMQGMHPIDKGLVLQAKNRREMGKSGIAAVAPQEPVEPEGRMGISTSINEPSNVPPTATLPPDPTLITPADQTGIGQLDAAGGLPPDIIAKEKELQAMEESLRAQKATEEATRPIAGQAEAEEAAGLAALNEYRKQQEDAVVQEDAAVLAAKQAEAAKNQAGWDAYRNANRGKQGIQQASDLYDPENMMNDPAVYAREAAQGVQQAQPQGQPLPTIEQLAPVQQAVTPVPLNTPEEDAGIAKLAQTPPQAPARMSTPEQTYAATATPDSYSQGLAKLRKAMEIDNPMPEIRTKESEKNVKEREAQRQDVEDNNLGWSVMQAAAAMMAGDSPYASVNIGHGALAGLQKYAEGKKTIRDLGKDINALQADREAALNSRDYQKYTLKQNQLAMMTELAERAQQAELQRQSVEGIHQLDRESAERMAKDRNAAMLKSAGLRGAGSGGGNLDDWIRASTAIDARKDAAQKEYYDRMKDIANIIDPNEKAKAEIDAKQVLDARMRDIGMKESIINQRAGIPTIGGAGVINTGDLPPSVKPLPPEKGEAEPTTLQQAKEQLDGVTAAIAKEAGSMFPSASKMEALKLQKQKLQRIHDALKGQK